MKFTKKNKTNLNKTRKNRDISFIKKINKEFDSQLDTKLVSKLSKEFKTRMVHDSTSIPSLLNKYSYYTEIKKGENYPKYYVIDDEKHKCILDLDKIGKSYSFFSVSSITFSNREDMIFYSVDTIGNRFHDIYMKPFFSDKLTKIISDVEGDIQISKDDKCIYYLKMNKSMRPYKLFCYNFEKNNHKCMFKEDDDTFSLSLSGTTDRNHVLLTSFSWESSYTHNIENDGCKLLYKKEKDLYYSVDSYNDTWYIMYTKNNTSKIISTTDFKNYSTILPNKENIEYQEFIIKSHYLCCVYKENGLDHLLSIDLVTKKATYFKFNNPIASFSIPSLSNLDVCSPKIIMNVYNYSLMTQLYLIYSKNQIVQNITSYTLWAL